MVGSWAPPGVPNSLLPSLTHGSSTGRWRFHVLNTACLSHGSGGSLYLIFYLVCIPKWEQRRFLHIQKLLSSTWEGSTFLGPLPTFPLDWPFPSPSLYLVFHGSHGSTNLCLVSLPPKKLRWQTGPHLPTSPGGGMVCLDLIQENRVKVQLYNGPSIFILWIHFCFSRWYYFEE